MIGGSGTLYDGDEVIVHGNEEIFKKDRDQKGLLTLRQVVCVRM
jgi:hypothetical protein